MKNIYILFIALLIGASSYGQVSTNSGSGLASTYPSLAAAITALNAATITDPVIITLSGNETAPAGGYAITQLGGTSGTPITIKGSSSTITAGLQTAGSETDAIFKIIGGDYITIKNFTLLENTGNTVTTHASNTMTEFGIALFMNSATDGAQNDTIQNNIITLGATYQDAIGFFSTSSSSSTNGAMEASSTAGTNSNNTFYGNTISNVAYGMYFICHPVTSSVFESGIDIGGSSAGTANTITFGIATASTLGWNNFSSALPAGISFRNGGPGSNVRYNSITSHSFSYAQSGGLGGIVTTIGTAASSVPYTTTWSNNTIVLTNNGTTPLTGIDFGYGLSTGDIVCSNNNITLNNSQALAISAAIIGVKANYPSSTNTANTNTIIINQTFSPAVNQTNSTAITAMNLSGSGTTLTANTNNITINQTSSPTAAISSTISGSPVAVNLSASATTIDCLNNIILFNQVTSMTTGLAKSYITGALDGILATTASTTVNIGSNGNPNSITVKQTASATGLTYYTNPVTYINAAADHGTLNIQYNNLNTTGSTLKTTGATFGINHNGIISNALNVTNNTLNIDRAGSGQSNSTGAFYGIYSQSATGELSGGYNINSNSITLKTISTDITAAIYNDDGGTPTKNFNSNTISITVSGSLLYGFYLGNGTCNVGLNNITVTSTAASPGIYGIYASPTGILYNINNNTFNNLTASGQGDNSPAITAILVTAGTNNTIYSNIIKSITTGISSTGNATISAIEVSGGTSSDIYKNKIYGLASVCSGTSTIISGIRISGGITNNIYNNIIGNITATHSESTDAIRGINIASTLAYSSNNVIFNTVYLNAASTGTNFGTSGIYHAASATASTATLDLRNNIIVNTSTANGTGLSVAYRRSNASLDNYASSSNNNLFYAGTPGGSKLIFFDGTNSDQTIEAFKARVSPRDALSISENPNWVSTSGSNANFLHINTSIITGIESGGVYIAAITDDFDGDARNSPPDIGADEFAGLSLSTCSGAPSNSTIIGVNSLCTGNETSLSLSTIYTETGITYQWASSTVSGGPYSNMGTSETQATGILSETTHYVCSITCSYSGLTFISDEKQIVINTLPPVAISPTSGNYCIPNGTSVTLTATGATSYSWSPAAGLNSQVDSVVTAGPATSTVYTVTGTDGNGCANTASTSITVAGIPIDVLVTATPDSICFGSYSDLASSAYFPALTTTNNYLFTTDIGATLDPMTGATVVIGSSVEDAPTADPVEIGFSFDFDGTTYTQYSVSPDGWILLGGATATPQYTNATTNGTNVPKIYPFWDDLTTGTDGNVKTLLTGIAPNRIFIVQWFVTIPRLISIPANSTFQAWLYETTNKIEFRYGPMYTPISGSISSGLTGATCTNLNSITFSSNTASNSAANDLNAITPNSGRIYTFIPPSVDFTYSWDPALDVVSPTAQNTATNALTANTTFTITVTNSFCSSTASSTVIVKPLLGTADVISGTVIQCPGITGQIFSTSDVLNATLYNWTVPPGWSITGGQGTTSITVTTGSAGQNGDITFTASNSCGSSSSSLPMTVSPAAPAIPGAISGAALQGPGLTGQIYSIAAVTNASTYTWTVPFGWSITGGQGTTSITVTTGSDGQNGDIAVTAGNSCGTSSEQTLAVTVTSGNITLNLTSVLLEGLYESLGTMIQAKDNNGPHWVTGVADHITVELRNASNYANIIYTAADMELSTTGNATVNIPGIYNASYYITIKHRNSVETTTIAPVSFAGSTINQSFGATTDVYGGNLKLSNDSYYLIYAGDINHDGFVDTGDYAGIDNDSYNFSTGYLDTDVNGDGIIDTYDYIAIDNNNYNFIGTAHP